MFYLLSDNFLDTIFDDDALVVIANGQSHQVVACTVTLLIDVEAVHTSGNSIPKKQKRYPTDFSVISFSTVRLIGLEPTQLALLDPKSSASTNFATGAGFECRKLNNSTASQSSLFEIAGAKIVIFFELQNNHRHFLRTLKKIVFF